MERVSEPLQAGRGAHPASDDSHVAMSVNPMPVFLWPLRPRLSRSAGERCDRWPVAVTMPIRLDIADPMGRLPVWPAAMRSLPDGALMPATVVDEAQVGDSADFDTETESVCPSVASAARCRSRSRTKRSNKARVSTVLPTKAASVKGRFGFDYIHHPHRLTKIRRDDAPPRG